MKTVDANGILTGAIIQNMSLSLNIPIRAIDRQEGTIEARNDSDALKIVEYLKNHGYPNATIQE